MTTHDSTAKSMEQQAREMLDRMNLVGKTEATESCMSCVGVDALDLTGGDVIELANLLRDLAAAQKDSKRLDWLCQTGDWQSIESIERGGAGMIINVYDGSAYGGKDIRIAVDVAIDAASCAERGGGGGVSDVAAREKLCKYHLEKGKAVPCPFCGITILSCDTSHYCEQFWGVAVPADKVRQVAKWKADSIGLDEIGGSDE